MSFKSLTAFKDYSTRFFYFFYRPDSDLTAGMNKDLNSAETVQGFAGTLVPLLLEVWVEAAGGECVQTDSGHLLSPESMALMFQILTILQLLRRLTPQGDQQDILVHTHKSVSYSSYYNVDMRTQKNSQTPLVRCVAGRLVSEHVPS